MPPNSVRLASTKVGLSASFDALLKSHNEAATDLLLEALNSPVIEIQDAALETLLKRRTLFGHQQIMVRLPKFAARQRSIVAANHHRLGRVVRDAILSQDREQFAIGSRIALEFRDYEMLPSLLQVAESSTNPNRELAAQHVLELTEALYQELGTQRGAATDRDPQLMRSHMLHSLEHSLVRYSQHRRTEIVEAFLLLAPHEHPLLVRILGNPMDGAYLPVIDVLTRSLRGGIVRLVLAFLEDPCAPSSVMTVVARRCDPKFLEHFLRKLGSHTSAAVNQNLRRIDTLPWMQNHSELVDTLDEIAQQGAVHLARTSGIQSAVAFMMIEHLLRHGKLAGRQAAAAALTGFHGADANQLVRESLADPDPQVQAHIIGQLRSRGIAGALPTLLAMLDHSHEVVCAAARRSLEEFSFDRYLTAFEMLDDRVRRETGPIVRKVDPGAADRLVEEMDARSRTRRLRAVAIAATMNLVVQLEAKIIERLNDEDHLVRAEAARALVQSLSHEARQALLIACHDRSVVVQEAAQQSLDEIAKNVRRAGETVSPTTVESIATAMNHSASREQPSTATPPVLSAMSTAS